MQNNLHLVLMFNEVCLGDLQVSEVRCQRVFYVILFVICFKTKPTVF